MLRLNIFDGEYCVDFVTISIECGYIIHWIIYLGKSFDTLSTREVLTNSGSPLQWFVTFIERSKLCNYCFNCYEILAKHPKGMVFYLTIRVCEELESAVSD